MEGEKEANSWTWVSTWKSLMVDSRVRRGSMYCWMASSMCQLEGEAEAANSEKVMWYVDAYLKALVVRFSMAWVVSGISLKFLLAVFIELPRSR